jgi:hypothetical protein
MPCPYERNRDLTASAAAPTAIAIAAQAPGAEPRAARPVPVSGSFVGGQLPLGQSHFPSKHVSPPVQALPQAPQLALSQQVATQTPLQIVSPSAQQSPLGQSQIPSKHVVPDEQELPHAPQCSLLQQVSTQTPPQSV